ncbi:MAG TPA: hypothetical protein VKY65_10630 [Alphaproteobacteria bacterium]|nr:hypothetical protein [Alphaproteobacteria bacterium]
MAGHGDAAKFSTKKIARIWKGRVKLAVADEYAAYLYESGVRHLKSVEGNLGVQMFRKSEQETAEFMVVSYWDPGKAQDAIRKFAGASAGKAWLLKKDREYLLDPDRAPEHYELLSDD